MDLQAKISALTSSRLSVCKKCLKVPDPPPNTRKCADNECLNCASTAHHHLLCDQKMINKDNLRLGNEIFFDEDIDTDESYIELVTQTLETGELYDVTHEESDTEVTLNPNTEYNRFSYSYVSVPEGTKKTDQLRFSTTIEVEENKLPSDYEVLPPHLLGDELLYLSSEKSLKATSLGDLLPKEVINQHSKNDDKMDPHSKFYQGNTTSDLKKNFPVSDLLPPPFL